MRVFNCLMRVSMGVEQDRAKQGKAEAELSGFSMGLSHKYISTSTLVENF